MTSESSTVPAEVEPLIPYANADDAPEYIKALLEPYMARMGFLPNALKLYMHRPEIAEVLWQLNDRVMRHSSSTLDQKLKRQLGTLASKLNGCNYCTSHNAKSLQNASGQAVEGWGYSDEDLDDLLSGEWRPEGDLELACFDFVTEATMDAENVSEETYAQLKEHLTPGQIVELAGVVGFWKLYNTIHLSLQIPLEAHIHDISRKTGL